MTRVASLVAGLGLVIAGCGSSGDEADLSGATDAPQEFCAIADSLSGETSEEYVGSPKHLTDTEALLDAAPEEVTDDLKLFRDFLASGAVDSEADPDSNVVANWPDDVQAAVADIREYISSRC